MRLSRTALGVALAAALPAAAAGAQPVLRDVTLWNSTATGAFAGGWWNTRPGDATYNVFLSSAADAGYAPGKILNPLATLAHALKVGTNDFWFYASSSASTHYGLNLFFGDDILPGNAAPHVSATAGYGSAGFAAIAGTTITRGTPNATNVGGAGTLVYTQGSFVVTLTNLEILGTAANSRIDRVSAESLGAGTSNDNYGRFTLQVVDTAAPVVTPEPGTWMLLATGLAGLGAVARRRRAA